MVRDTTTGKLNYSLVYDGPLVRRLAAHLTKGAEKYAVRNWMRAKGPEEMDRFRESAARHFNQWMDNVRDEDHFSATVFNMNGYEWLYENGVAIPAHVAVSRHLNGNGNGHATPVDPPRLNLEENLSFSPP